MFIGIDANGTLYFPQNAFTENNILQNVDLIRVLFYILRKTRYEAVEFHYRGSIITLNSGQVFIRDKEISRELKIEPKKVGASLRGLKKRGIITSEKLPTGLIITFPQWLHFSIYGEIQNG